MSSTKIINVLAISGSLRKASTNTGLLRAAAAVAPGNIKVEIANILDLPMFNEDIEAAGVPASVTNFRQKVKDADAILFASPENNYLIAAPLKNAIDWASRTPNVWDDKPAAIVSSGGGHGGGKSHYQVRQAAVYVNIHFLNKPEIFVQRFAPPAKFDQAGDVIDEELKKRLATLLEELGKWTNRLSAGKQALAN